jgi:Uncharacterized conserved protein (COG2071)
MQLPAIKGVIERRVLVNYRVDKDALQRVLPSPFRVKVVGGFGMAGVRLIRLAAVRPRFVPSFLGFASENAARRIAVEWDTPAGIRDGVFIPRRDTSSAINCFVGGRFFPGRHHRARFDVTDRGDDVAIALQSRDGSTRVVVEASVATAHPDTSIFGSLAAASAFFERGSIGYSATGRDGCFDCLELKSFEWRVQPLAVRRVESSFFSDPQLFPPGSASFDSALLMRGIPHEWRARGSLQAGVG